MLTDDGVTGILIAHLGAFGSGELKITAVEWLTKFCTCTMEITVPKILNPLQN